MIAQNYKCREVMTLDIQCVETENEIDRWNSYIFDWAREVKKEINLIKIMYAT